MIPRELLLRYPLYRLLGDNKLRAWIAAGRTLSLETGETLFEENTEGNWAYLILEGRVRIIKRASGNRELSLGTCGSGELVGDYALLPPHRNTVTCRIAASASVLRLPLAEMRTILSAHPEIQVHLKHWLRLHALTNQLRGKAFLGFLSAPSALMHLDRLLEVSFQAMRTVQTPGLADGNWYFIKEGAVAVHSDRGPALELGPGDYFGERALAGFAGLPTAVTLTATHAWCLSRRAFELPRGMIVDPAFQSELELRGPMRKCHWIGQREDADCGMAALAMIAWHYGQQISLEVLRPLARKADRGANLLELQRLAHVIGLRAHAVRADVNQLELVALPAIAHYSDGHFVVLFQIEPCRLTIGDPATGLTSMSASEFRRRWSGHLVLFSKE